MKLSTPIYSCILMCIIFLNSNCKKESTLPDLPEQILPYVTITADEKLVFLPSNICQIWGYVNNYQTNNYSIQWEKIAGPVSYTIENPDSLITNITNLERGIYEFEITMTLPGGLKSKDTCAIIVGEFSSSPRTKIIEKQRWIYDNGFGFDKIEIENFNSLVPPRTLFRTYIKQDSLPDWIEVQNIDRHVTTNPGAFGFRFIREKNGILTFANSLKSLPNYWDVKFEY